METTSLRELLKSFCSDSEWSYAVFWKLKQEGQMILEWEDGFCDYPRPRKAVHSRSGLLHNNEVEKFSCLDSATGLYDGSSSVNSVGLAVADMSSLQYIWGEGLIGEAACTGNHCWILLDDYFSIGTGFNLVPELPSEWTPQFLAGIKTILVTPVLPHGVLQLGSLESVAENMAVVTYVKDRFSSFKTAMSGSSASCKFEMNISAPTSVLSMLNFMDNLDESSSKINIQHGDCASEATNGSGSIASNLENINIMDQALLPSMRIDVPPLLKGAFGNESGLQPPGLTKEADSFDESLNAREPRITGYNFESSIAKSWLVSQSYCGFGEASDGASHSFFSEDMMNQAVGVGDLNSMCNTEMSQNCTLPVDCELYNSLNPLLQQQADNVPCGAFEAPLEGVHNKMICDKNLCNGGQVARKPGEWLDQGYGKGYLLEAVVANAYAGKNGSISNISDNLKSSSYSESLNQCGASTSIGDDFRSNVISGFVAEAQNKYSDSSSLTTFNSMISTLMNKEPQRKGDHGMHTRYQANSKKKTRPSDSRKPRPRDRQLMQDYLAELRQLVPNGTKFTIDGLLEQTVKHILFLRSVTGQAEKFKLWTNQKVSCHKESKIKKNCQNGRSWALELGSEDPVCPIMVEDLDITGLLLIEILCNEEDIFLDTAQVIIQSGLSILKGEMENQANNKWAKFIVQATKDFHRMDIFWPLMQLLQGKTTQSTEN